MTERYRARHHPHLLTDGAVAAGLKAGSVISLPCFKMQDLFDYFDITHVDFWTLDVEGGAEQRPGCGLATCLPDGDVLTYNIVFNTTSGMFTRSWRMCFGVLDAHTRHIKIQATWLFCFK